MPPQGGTEQVTVTYKGGQQAILVPPTVPVVTFVQGAMSDLTLGASVFVIATRDGGRLTARALAVGSDGVKPPM